MAKLATPLNPAKNARIAITIAIIPKLRINLVFGFSVLASYSCFINETANTGFIIYATNRDANNVTMRVTGI